MMVHTSNAMYTTMYTNTTMYFVDIVEVDYQQKEFNLQTEPQTVIYYNNESMFNVFQTLVQDGI